MRTLRVLFTMLALTLTGLIPCEAENPPDSAPTAAHLEPWMTETMSPKISRKLATAFPVAVERLRSEPGCLGLFEELDADGLERLVYSLYVEVTLRQEQRFCRGTSAFTMVGGRQTRLCRGFGRLADSQAAVVLIHEALHQAGMSEKPLDPQALDSSQINQLVRTSCVL